MTEDTPREAVAAERLESIMSALPDLLFELDEDGVHVDFHAAEHTALPIPPRAFLGRSLEEVMPPPVADLLRGAMDVARRGRVEPVHFSLPMPGGSRRHYEARIARKRPSGFLAVVRDTTSSRRAEESSRRLAAIAENTLDVVYTADPSGRLSYGNAAAREAVGDREDGLEGATIDDFHPAWFRRVLRQEGLPSAMATGVWSGEGALLHAEDGEIPVSVVLLAGRTPDGALDHFSVIMRDLREWHAMERRLAEAQRIESIGRLAGGVAHDFNNILAAVLMNANTLLSDEGMPEAMREALDDIREAGERGQRLTRQLLAFGRRQILRVRPLDLGEVVRELSPMLRRLIGEHVSLDVRVEPGHTSVEADRGQIEQVLMNLVLNARDAVGESGAIEIRVRPPAPGASPERPVTAGEGAPETDFVTLVVADDGVGMDAATAGRIFEPFFTTKPPGEGTGLGLSTAHGIVHQSGGRMAVQTEPGRGSRFEVLLPVHPEASSEAKEEEAAPVMGNGELVLLVEDEEPVRAVVHRTLVRHGYRVVEAGGGAQALRLVEDFHVRPRLLLTDVVMPCLGGRELAERLRDRWPGLPVLYMSGYTEDEVIRRGISAREVDFLQKPFSVAELTTAVRRVLDR